MDAVRSLMARRRDGHWANPLLAGANANTKALSASYDALGAAASFFELQARHSQGFSFASAEAAFAQYRNELFRFDQLYRAFMVATEAVDSGQWQFTDDEALKMAVEIFGGYAKTFGSSSSPATQIAIFKFLGDVPLGNWEADTRGGSITIASSDMPFRSQSLQRLHEQLRHEIFHLWIPNGVNLSGRYDWFYEGFALYQSLKLGVSVNRLRFEDYLNTVSGAILIDNFGSQRRSLIDAANNRWNGSDTQVYARGMLAAFICDLALLDKSKGKVSTDTLVAEIYKKHQSGADRTDGTAATLSMMRSHSELVPVIERMITGADKFEWPALLAAAGIEVVTANSTPALRVIAKPSGRQKDLLDKLGYNNWRKSTGNNR